VWDTKTCRGPKNYAPIPLSVSKAESGVLSNTLKALLVLLLILGRPRKLRPLFLNLIVG
jgi:hypothetical protein